MKENIVKRQHYVWRKYLREWSVKEVINSLIINTNKIVATSLMNVAQKRYFYKFSSLSKNDFIFLEHMCNSSSEPIKGLQNDLLEALKIYTALKEIQTDAKLQTSDVLDSLEKNGFEQLHSYIESEGTKLLGCRTLSDVESLFEDFESKYQALMFISFQYFRTKKMKDEILSQFKDEKTDLNFEDMFSFISIIMATKIAQNISFDKKLKISLLEINKDYSFITSDQPIINLSANGQDTTELDFYYPIAPKYAIKIQFNGNQDKYFKYEPDISEVNYLNSKMKDEANEFIFAKTENELKNYTQ